jgi:uncharacterized protein YndB with AHSA1/START domain
MSKPEFVYTIFIKTTPEKLWHALTDRAFTESYWYGCSLRSDWRVGSRMEMYKGGRLVTEGEILECDPPRRMSYRWHSLFDDEIRKEAPSRVTYVLEPAHNAVKLTVTHEGFPAGSQSLPDISTGWPMVLSSLKSVIETGEPLLFETANAA